MTSTQQTVAMVFGAVLALAGVVLFATKPSEGETTAKVLGIEVTVKTPSIVIFALGCIIFLSPFVPFFRPEIQVVVTGTPSVSPSPTPDESIRPVAELEAEPVDADVADDHSVWVALIERDSGPRLTRLDPSTLQPNSPLGFVGVPVKVVAEGDSVWVLTQQGVLPISSQFATPVPLGGVPLRAYPALESLWILLQNSDVVVRFDMATDQITNRIPVGNVPRFLVLAGGKMWVASVGDWEITPITPSNNPLPAIPLPAAPVALINFNGEPLVATADGSVIRVDPDSGVTNEIAHVSAGETHLIPAGNHVWAWHTGDSSLWRIDPTGESPEQPALPFAVEKLARLGKVLWVVAADGQIAEIDADDGSPRRSWGPIEDRPSLIARDEERRRLVLFAEDGTVYQLPP